jgi:hypothetical protein
MEYENSRRCALWVSARVLVAAEELADLIGIDVDTFIEGTVLALRDQEAAEGRLRARAAAVEKSSKGQVIPMADRSKRYSGQGDDPAPAHSPWRPF